MASTQNNPINPSPLPQKKEKRNHPRFNLQEPLLLLAPSGVWLLLLLVLPTLIIFALSLVPDIKPGDIVNPTGFDNYIRIFDPLYVRVIWRSMYLAVNSTFICLLMGLPVSFYIARKVSQRWQNLLLIAIVLPFWTSSLLRSYAWITILRRSGLLNIVLNSLGLPKLELLNHTSAVLIGMSYSLLPYMILILYASFEKLDKGQLEAAADLGANSIQTFWKIIIPQTMTGIFAGCFLVFITALGDFINPELLGGASSMTAARLIYNQFLGATQNWGFGSALSMTIILLVSIAIALLIKFGESKPYQ